MQFSKEKRILGIDPGTNITGYSIIEQRGKQTELLTMSCIVLGTKMEMSTKMKILFDKVSAIIEVYKPDMLAIEAPLNVSPVPASLCRIYFTLSGFWFMNAAQEPAFLPFDFWVSDF